MTLAATPFEVVDNVVCRSGDDVEAVGRIVSFGMKPWIFVFDPPQGGDMRIGRMGSLCCATRTAEGVVSVADLLSNDTSTTADSTTSLQLAFAREVAKAVLGKLDFPTVLYVSCGIQHDALLKHVELPWCVASTMRPLLKKVN